MQPIDKSVKGRPLIGYLKYIKKKWGQNGLAAAESDIGIRMSEIGEDKWYPATYSDDVIVWISKTHGKDEVRKAAISMVSEVGVISFFARVAGLEKVLDRAVEEVKESLSFGNVTVEKAPGKATVRIYELCRKPDVCEAWQGIIEGTMVLTRTKGKVEKKACQLKGQDACTYVMTWEP